jgi:hypothetical protein
VEERLTVEDGRQALDDHAHDRGVALREAYGPVFDAPAMARLLADTEHVRFPTRIEFNSRYIEPGTFAVVREEGDSPSDGYVIHLHEHFAGREDAVPPLVFYQLVTVNYGDFATRREAETFGAAALGMDRDSYYELVCRLTDGIPGPA